MAEYPSWITHSPLERKWDLCRGNSVSRLCEIKAIAIHYVEGPGQNAYDVKATFQARSNTEEQASKDLPPSEQGSPFVGAHFVIDDSRILALAPSNNYVFWHVGDQVHRAGNIGAWNKNNPMFIRGANFYTIAIEHCHADKTGRFTPAVLKNSHRLVRWLMQEYGHNILIGRHYDFSGKCCPIYFAPVLRGKNDSSWDGRHQPEFPQSEMLEVQIKTGRWEQLLAYYRQSNGNAIPSGIL